MGADYMADGKGGADWMPIRSIAHRLIMGAEDDAIKALKAMLKQLLAEMERRFALFAASPHLAVPTCKLRRNCRSSTSCRHLRHHRRAAAVPDSHGEGPRRDRSSTTWAVSPRGPAAGFISNFASQRPDADSVPTKLREIVTIRYSTQVIDQTSSDMVLGKELARATCSVLSDDQQGRRRPPATGPALFVTVRPLPRRRSVRRGLPQGP